MKLKLSDVMIAMREGGFLSKQTGAVAIAQKAHLLHNYDYEYIAWPDASDRVIDVPPVDCLAFMKEFIDMQSFPDSIKAECGFVLDEHIPIVLKRDANGLAAYEPAECDGLFTLLGRVGMEMQCSIYVESRLAGMARKWCYANGYDVIEDFSVYDDNYA